MNALISIDHIVKNDKLGKPILDEITAKIMEGELITIIGPSGSGKSTFLSLVNRMSDPDSGALLFKDKPYLELDVLQLRRKIGMVFQMPTMLPGTVRDNLSVGPKLYGEKLNETDIEGLLELVGLPVSMLDQDARSLSGGQKQRVSLARTLANKPEILLLDEVTASLDPHSTEEIEKLVEALHRKGTSILWVTHNLKQARKIGQYTWVIAAGQIVEQGDTKEIFDDPKHEITREFIQSSFETEMVSS